MRDRKRLFFEDSLDAVLRARLREADQVVNDISTEQFLISSDDEVVEHVSAELAVTPLQLHEEAMSMDQSETQVDVSRDRDRFFGDEHKDAYYIPGTRVTVNIPFTGEPWIFKYRTSPSSTVFPSSDVLAGSGDGPGAVRISITKPHDADPSSFKAVNERELKLIRECVEWSSKQIKDFNAALPDTIRRAVLHRRERLAKHNGIAAIMDIPLAPRKGAPSLKPVTVEIQKPPPLPVPPKTGLEPEPGIKPELYEQILHFIRHQGRTFETMPATFGVHDEEGLRDVILAQLNGHFKGAATGEAFRRSGKTDIRIEEDDRAAFVGECKNWTGEAGVIKAINQLLGYLTWRDSKAALIIFNKQVKGFSTVLEKLPAAVRSHLLFIREMDCSEHGEWRMLMRSAEDEGRRVTLHIFAFNIYSDKLERRVSPQ